MCFKKLLFILLVLFTFFIVEIQASTTPRILIKIPTRARYEQFFKTLDQYYAHLSNKTLYHFLISCDLDDPIMNSPQTIAKLKTYSNLSFYFGNNANKIAACNADLDKHLDFDILILASDDMIPRAFAFDEDIVALFEVCYPDFDGVLHFDDGSLGNLLNTLPIIGKKYYERFGYIYFPNYKSFHSDNEMTDVSRMLNKVTYINKMIIEHQHPANGKGKPDCLYQMNDKYWLEDQELYHERKAKNFDLKAGDIVNAIN